MLFQKVAKLICYLLSAICHYRVAVRLALPLWGVAAASPPDQTFPLLKLRLGLEKFPT